MLFILIGNVKAADMVLSTEGFQDVGENEVNLIKQLNLQNAQISVDGDISVLTMRRYTSAEIADGTYEYEKQNNPEYIWYGDVTDRAPVIVYNGSLSKGESSINGSISIRWANAAKLKDGTICDVEIYIDNIVIKVAKNTVYPIGLVGDWESQLVLIGRMSYQEVDGWYTNIGAAYDVEVSLKKNNAKVTGNNMVIGFNDLDVEDRFSDKYSIDGVATPYSEGITLISGVTDKIYLRDDNYLIISNTDYGQNTKFTGTQRTTNSKSKPNESWKAGFMTRVDAGGFKFRWQGGHCDTFLGFLSPYKVETAVLGNYPDKVQMTKTDEEVLWKNNKEIEIIPDNGYYISKLIVDGEETPVSVLIENNGKYIYSFNSVVENHSVEVQVDRIPYTVVTNHYKEGTSEEVISNSSLAETKYRGENYTTSALTNLPEGYVLVGTPANATGTIEDSDVVVNYYYKLKDLRLTVKHVDEAGNDLVPASTESYVYGSNYETSQMDNDEYELISNPSNAAGVITGDIEVIYRYRKKTVIPPTGKITVKYIDTEGNEISTAVITQKEVGSVYTSSVKSIEGYVLKEKPVSESFTYAEEEQVVMYIYEKIKLKVEVRVNGIGGIIEGEEEVLYGNDSTKDKIKIKADDEYVVDKVLINGEEIKIQENSKNIVLSNFVNMKDNKLVEVLFKEVKKPERIVDVPSTGKGISVVIAVIFSVLLVIFVLLYKYYLEDD